jgi:hypothetical protein
MSAYSFNSLTEVVEKKMIGQQIQGIELSESQVEFILSYFLACFANEDVDLGDEICEAYEWNKRFEVGGDQISLIMKGSLELVGNTFQEVLSTWNLPSA